MFRNQSASTHQFAMVPRAEIPRSGFTIQKTHKTTFDAGWLIPIYLEECLPGDSFKLNMTLFARLATPLFPVMDNLTIESFFFFCPNRLVWQHWSQFMGERYPNPSSSIDYQTPLTGSAVGGYAVGSLQDHLGLPTVGQVGAGFGCQHIALPTRMYNLIWNEWFRDENLQDALTVDTGDGPDNSNLYVLQRRGKRHDYFTSCLPWTQKGTSVSLPLGTEAPVKPRATNWDTTGWNKMQWKTTAGSAASSLQGIGQNAGNDSINVSATGLAAGGLFLVPGNLYADLTAATAATINQIRQAFQIQRLLERDARGGSRYTEIIRAHFGVTPQDQRLNRPEYLGGGSSPITINPVAQTSNTGVATTPQGNLAAFGTGLARGHGFTYACQEHGFIMGLVSVRADLSYQQGMHKMWTRRTRYDYYWPVFANLGEQAVYQGEIYFTGDSAQDNLVFGYQERWAEYRYGVSQITGLMRSTAAGTIDPWHLAQRFTSAPTLNSTFIQDTPPVQRITAVGAAANGQQFLCDAFFNIRAVRPMPMYSVPGMIDHF